MPTAFPGWRCPEWCRTATNCGWAGTRVAIGWRGWPGTSPAECACRQPPWRWACFGAGVPAGRQCRRRPIDNTEEYAPFSHFGKDSLVLVGLLHIHVQIQKSTASHLPTLAIAMPKASKIPFSRGCPQTHTAHNLRPTDGLLVPAGLIQR